MANLEICCFNTEAALVADRAGADRIEFCMNRSSGGVSPVIEDVYFLSNHLSIPFRVMVRCRVGNFVYTSVEITEMLNYIQSLKNSKAEGIVFGALTSEADIDISVCEIMYKAAYPLKVTFHKAFDEVKDPFQALETLKHLKVDTILTSGLQATALEGKHLIKQLREHAGSIQIMAGGGIRSTNLEILKAYTGCEWLHSAAILNEGELPDEAEIKALKNLLYNRVEVK